MIANDNSPSKSNNNHTFQQFYRRRLQDIRIWNKIRAQGLERAAINISKGFRYICWGAQIPTSSWSEKVSCSYNPNGSYQTENTIEYLSFCKKRYLQWADICNERGFNHHAVLDIIFFGQNVSDVDKIYRHRHGWAIKNMLEALELYEQ